MDPETIAGRYRVVRAIGRGGMGTVWLCRDEVLDREVAVKRIGALPGEESRSTARAMREARVAAALNHEHAVSVYDVVDHDERTWLVMEYLPSRTLAEIVAAEGALEPQRVAFIGAQVADALDTAHGLGIVHRDIKPGNVLVGPGDVAKISDFGIARGHTDLSLTQTGMMTGTPGYFAPELARGGDPSFASDAWALGATLYAAVEGRTPYSIEANPLAVLSAITRDDPRPTERAGPLAPVIARLMDREPERRWSMDRTREELRTIARGVPQAVGSRTAVIGVPAAPAEAAAHGSASPPGEPPTQTAPTDDDRWLWSDRTEQADDRPPRRRAGWWPWGIAVVVLLLVTGLGLAAWAAFAPNDDSAQTGTSAGRKPSGPAHSGPAHSTPTAQESPTTSSSPTGTTTASTTPPAGGSPAEAESFVSDYFTLVPGNLDAGWAELSPEFQQSMGRSTYDGFWTSIDSVDVSNVRATSATTVDYTIVYHESNGGTSTEQKQISLVRSGSSYLISGDQSQG